LNKTFNILEKVGLYIGRLSLILALLAFYPSIAPFTPAILVSVFSFFGAIVGALFGEIRLAILTIYIVIATFLVSPVFKWVEVYIRLDILVIGLILLGVILAIGLNMHYKATTKK
jgi:hypothetical protein